MNSFRTEKVFGILSSRVEGIKDRLEVPTPSCFKQDEGSLTFEVFPLEDWVTSSPRPTHFKHLPHGFHRLLISDSSSGDPATPFAVNWDQGWHPQLFVKWGGGKLYPEMLAPKQKPFALCGHFRFNRKKWYQIAVVWKHSERQLRMYINGVLVAHEDVFLEKYNSTWDVEPVGDRLYYGGQDHYVTKPRFTENALSEQEVQDGFKKFIKGTDQYADPENIRDIHAGKPTIKTLPSASAWENEKFYSLTNSSDLDSIYLQGYKEGVVINEEGMTVRTSQKNPVHQVVKSNENQGHLYVWFKEFIEGDIRLEYDFKILERGGLSLFMAQAAGIQGEKFMEDYPLRTDGAMRMVCWEDVRNYHLEYYREMNDVRNDVATFALMKNPWLCPLGYATRKNHFEINEWYHLAFIQEDESLKLFINDDLIIETYDNPLTNNGPVLQRGYVALRCMVRTSMCFRNVSICSKALNLNSKGE